MPSAMASGFVSALGLDDQDRPVGRPQILPGGLLNQLRRHLAELLLEAVDPARVVVEEREGREQVRAAEAEERSRARS